MPTAKTEASQDGQKLLDATRPFAEKSSIILPTEEWTYFQGALESSSYTKLGPIMKWFTGNIGYHRGRIGRCPTENPVLLTDNEYDDKLSL